MLELYIPEILIRFVRNVHIYGFSEFFLQLFIPEVLMRVFLVDETFTHRAVVTGMKIMHDARATN